MHTCTNSDKRAYMHTDKYEYNYKYNQTFIQTHHVHLYEKTRAHSLWRKQEQSCLSRERESDVGAEKRTHDI